MRKASPEPDSPRGGRSGSAAWLLVFLLAVLLYAFVGLRLLPDREFLKYPLAAAQLAAGELPVERLADFSPLYLALHQICHALPAPLLAARVFHGLALALAVALFFALLRQRLGLWLAVLGAVILVTERSVMVYAHVFEPEILLLALAVGLLLLVAGEGRWRMLLAGACGGLALATRPTLAPLVAAVPLYLTLRGSHRARGLRESAWFLLPVVVVVGLLMARSASVTGSATTPTMNPGTVFFEGNNPLSRGTSAIYPPVVLELSQRPDARPDSAHEDYRRVARASDGQLGVGEANRFWSVRARRFLMDEPLAAGRLLIDKLLLALHSRRLHDVPVAALFDTRLRLPFVPFGWVVGLGLCGMLLLVHQWRSLLPLYVLGVAQIAVQVVFYASARQRLLLVPVLIFFGLAAVVELASGPPGGAEEGAPRWRALTIVLVTVALGLALSIPHRVHREEERRHLRSLELQERRDDLLMRFAAEPPAWHTTEIAETLALLPEVVDLMRPAFLSQEEEPFVRAMARAVDRRAELDAADRFDLGYLLLRAGDLKRAGVLFTDLVEEGYVGYRRPWISSRPGFFLGRIAALRGDRRRALGILEDELRAAPGEPFLLAELLALTEEPRYQELLERYFSPLDAQLLLGRAFLAHGEAVKAVGCFSYVVRRLPDLRSGRLHLAAALGASGDLEAALEQTLRSLQQGVEPVLLDPEIPDLMRAWGERSGGSAALLQVARVLHQYGYLGEALDLVQQARDRLADSAEEQRVREVAEREEALLELSLRRAPASAE